MILCSFVLAAVSCVADVTTWTPTPSYRWDHDGVDLAGFRIYWRNSDRLDGGWDGSFDLPLETIVDEDTGATTPTAAGWTRDMPMQRFVDGEQVEIVFVIRAFDVDNNESLPSSEVVLCLPKLWQPGEVYE